MAKYIAYTTVNYGTTPFEIVAEHGNKEECRRLAEATFDGIDPAKDLYNVTRLKNLSVLSETEFKKEVAIQNRTILAIKNPH